jgi:Uma2 family endonuclease
MTVQIARRRFTVDDYYRMAEAGILHEDDRVELIEGHILEMSPGDGRPAGAPRLFTVKDYYRMAEAGIFHEDDRVELIEGEIVEMTPIGSWHASVVDVLNNLLVRKLSPASGIVRVQSPIHLHDLSEPQPDVSVLKPRPDRYRAAHPGPEDLLLIIEVADSSVDYDRVVKLPLYARSGIPEVWIVYREAEAIEIHRQASGEGFREVRRALRGETISPAALPDVWLEVGEVLG